MGIGSENVWDDRGVRRDLGTTHGNGTPNFIRGTCVGTEPKVQRSHMDQAVDQKD